MIRAISLKNFKSYRSAEIQLAPLTFLIGANASGKSNALEAIRLLSWLAKGSRLDDIARSIEGADTLVRGQAIDLFQQTQSDNFSFTLGCDFINFKDDWCCLELEISLLDDQLVISKEEVRKSVIYDEPVPLYSVDSSAKKHTDEVRVKYNNFSKGPHKPLIPCSNRQAIFYQLETPGRFEKKHVKSQRIIPEITKSIRENLRKIVFLDPRPSLMREYAYLKNDQIVEDGSNLSSVLYKICNHGAMHKTKLLNFIRSLPEQDITDVRFIKTERNDVMVRLVESFGGIDKEIDAPLLSDGTLRVLAVAATVLSAPSGSLVVIEEIDNGVHPSRAKTLVSEIQKISEERGIHVLVTTHNPALLDSIPDDALGDVLCCYRDPDEGDSRIRRLKDLSRFPELVAQGALGELVTQRILDRFLKDKTTKVDRKKQAKEWLKELKAEVSD